MGSYSLDPTATHVDVTLWAAMSLQNLSLWENTPLAPLIYDLIKHFSDEFVGSDANFKSYLIERDIHFVI